MPKYIKQMGRDLYSALDEQDLLEFGSVIPGHYVREIIDLDVPAMGTQILFREIALTELSAVDYIRNILLNQGKYLTCNQGDYRILLPSENARQCERYITSASKKLNRSLKLSRNTPAGDHPPLDQTTVRALMKKESIRKL